MQCALGTFMGIIPGAGVGVSVSIGQWVMEHQAELTSTSEQRGNPIIIMAWCLGLPSSLVSLVSRLAAAVYLPVLVASCTKSWRVAFGLTLGTYLFFVISIDIFKLVGPAPGLLAEWLGVRDSNRSSSPCWSADTLLQRPVGRCGSTQPSLALFLCGP
jgi:hypothetical protein